MENSEKKQPTPVKDDSKIIKEGGYQPTTDPGAVPEILVRPTTSTPAEPAAKPAASGQVSTDSDAGSGEGNDS